MDDNDAYDGEDLEEDLTEEELNGLAQTANDLEAPAACWEMGPIKNMRPLRAALSIAESCGHDICAVTMVSRLLVGPATFNIVRLCLN